MELTKTYESSTLSLYRLTIDDYANELRNRVIAYGYAHNHPDDAYLFGRGLLGAILNELPSIDLDDTEYALIQTVDTWAQSVITTYRLTNAAEIAEYEATEGKSLTDTECFHYATA